MSTMGSAFLKLAVQTLTGIRSQASSTIECRLEVAALQLVRSPKRQLPLFKQF